MFRNVFKLLEIIDVFSSSGTSYNTASEVLMRMMM